MIAAYFSGTKVKWILNNVEGARAAAESLWRAVAATTNVSPRAFAIAAVNLMDEGLLRKAYDIVGTQRERRTVGLRLGRALLRRKETAEEGARRIRGVVRDSPDAEGALDAFLAIAEAELAAERWKSAADVYAEAAEIWPDAA